jgi:hypothetical protein
LSFQNLVLPLNLLSLFDLFLDLFVPFQSPFFVVQVVLPVVIPLFQHSFLLYIFSRSNDHHGKNLQMGLHSVNEYISQGSGRTGVSTVTGKPPHIRILSWATACYPVNRFRNLFAYILPIFRVEVVVISPSLTVSEDSELH